MVWHRNFGLQRDDFPSKRHPAVSFCWRMIFSRKPVPTFRDHALWTRTLTAIGIAALAVLAFSGWSGAFAQMAPAPTGHRQPKAGDVPKDTAKQTPRSPEDIALDRALNNICRGCSPIIPVRSVPRYDVARTCAALSGDGTDRCRQDEETARQKLNEQWTQFSERARSDCVQTNEIGGRPTYVQLGICLKTREVAPTLPEGQ